MLIPIVMAGGSGTRLWPLSRSNYPKQFLKLFGKQTMLQETVNRLKGLDHAPVMFICNEEHRFIAAEQVRQLGIKGSSILLEPVARNTAPAIAIAAFKAIQQNNDPLLLVLPADHLIKDIHAFHSSVNKAINLAKNDKLVTFGVTGITPETGYGYIKKGGAIDNGYSVNRFVEKPDLVTAKKYIECGDYYWNSGMFLFKAHRYLKELKVFQPDIYEFCKKAISLEIHDNDFIRVEKTFFEKCPNESVDYAVMEHTKDAVVVPMDAGWNDLGGFDSLWQVSKQDKNGNVFKGDVKAVNTVNSFVLSDDKLVATVGVKDLVIVNTKDSVLVVHKQSSENVKAIVQQLKEDNRSEVSNHREVYRPWGKYDSVDRGERFQVKRITVKPGAKLSVQMHHHRAEHWIVVSGTAKVKIDDTEQYLTENESVYIPITAVHSLENPGKVDLEIIEVQSGSYLDEDDIVRFEDLYGRIK